MKIKKKNNNNISKEPELKDEKKKMNKKEKLEANPLLSDSDLEDEEDKKIENK